MKLFLYGFLTEAARFFLGCVVVIAIMSAVVGVRLLLGV